MISADYVNDQGQAWCDKCQQWRARDQLRTETFGDLICRTCGEWTSVFDYELPGVKFRNPYRQ